MAKVAAVIVNWNTTMESIECIESMNKQSEKHTLLVVDNGSSDDFCDIVEKTYSNCVLLRNSANLGFSGGVNTGIRYAIENNYDYVALINSDAKPNKDWLKELVSAASDKMVGIATGKLLKTDGAIDSTGDFYTSWGLAYPRGRNEKDNQQYNAKEEVFGASGGASLYKVDMLQEIGLFDEDFFAYYEDVDISFRAQLAGWKVVYNPKAVAYHKIGASSSKVPGLTTYMTIKNLPWLFWKNVPFRLVPVIWPRFFIAHASIIFSALSKGALVPVIKGLFVSFLLFPKKLVQRYNIQKSRKVSAGYIKSITTYDLPPNAHKLMKIRSMLKVIRFWK